MWEPTYAQLFSPVCDPPSCIAQGNIQNGGLRWSARRFIQLKKCQWFCARCRSGLPGWIFMRFPRLKSLLYPDFVSWGLVPVSEPKVSKFLWQTGTKSSCQLFLQMAALRINFTHQVRKMVGDWLFSKGHRSQVIIIRFMNENTIIVRKLSDWAACALFSHNNAHAIDGSATRRIRTYLPVANFR